MKKIIKFLIVCGVLSALFTGCAESTEHIENTAKDILSDVNYDKTVNKIKEINNENTESENSLVNIYEDNTMMVHFIDVEQGDCSLIESNGEYMLIDAGDNDKGTLVQNYLQKRGITTLKYVIGTHPDADHYGGLDVIISKFNCETILLPEYQKDTATCRDVYDTISYYGYKETTPKVGDVYKLGSATITILGPISKYEDSNNNSIVLLVKNKEDSFLFTGDAEEISENDILTANLNIKADVLKVGHHGSRTASSDKFLKAISPTYAVISCGENNDYGHPHAEPLNRFREMGISVFRTDEQGTIIATSNGDNEIMWNSAPSTTWKSGE